MKEFLSVADLCDVLNISKSTVHKMSSNGVIPVYKPPGSKLIYFKGSDVLAHLENGRIPSKSEIQSQTLLELSQFK
ncbi:helix-turn-helix domain-containing protein [Mucilaginibacter sp. E4BP6]|uniref:helix-turn-helix domain-containing protein n=1 Tax=Mucilaginibacter sp. E4BP6 TaxID=2723089 RepID=UPI0015C92B09|nr:helix-turn-helix domain-containing protein [Mucilaginibacter sp. E4BP6]NYE68660.1 excisionase family DNA binding protein [Mucilaginibacter sp. E4BP6]